MAGGIKQLSKGEILFREGDPSDAMYVIKKGKIAITKAKGNSEIVLAELMPGEMLGEMAFKIGALFYLYSNKCHHWTRRYISC